jgi:uncharacterized protein YigE (DUF2233 family)
MGMKIWFVTFLLFSSTVFSQELSFTYNKQSYDAIIVNTNKADIRMHWRDEKGLAFRSITALKAVLTGDVLMITNGGMFQPGNVPVGLFVENGQVIRPLDTATDQPGNFYLLPNGVFYIDKKGPHVTANFKEQEVRFATQSGPMLVIDGQIHPLFKQGSPNLNLRSGVGIMPDGSVVFVISKSNQTNFYDLAVIFRDKFGCKNALYLDGAISKMYLKESRKDDMGGDFGVMISVVKK